MTPFLLDTHYWIWFQMGDASQIGTRVRDELLAMQRAEQLYVSAISVWEIARLVSDDQLDLGMSIDQFLEEGTRSGGFQILPLSPRVMIESTRLPGEIHKDPADRVLIASAREHGMMLLTRDKAILKYAERGYLSASRK